MMNRSVGARILMFAVLIPALSAVGVSRADRPPSSDLPRIDAAANAASAVFVPNPGLGDGAILFRTLIGSGTLLFERQQVVFQPPACDQPPVWFRRMIENGSPAPEAAKAPRSPVRLHFVGADPDSRLVGREALSGVVNYYLGDDPSSWRTDVPTFAGLAYEGLYPGIDLLYDGGPGVLKGTFIVAPGADPGRIAWLYEGTTPVRLSEGELLIGADESGANPLFVEGRPVARQTVDGERVDVDVRYLLRPDGRVGLDVGRYDAAEPLVIDPVLSYSTYWGGAGCDGVYGIALDAKNCVYITGGTNSPGYPPSDSHCDETRFFDVYVTKLDPSKTGPAQHVYTTYVGGADFDLSWGVEVDAAGNVFGAGTTRSRNLPTTKTAFQRTYNGGDYDNLVFQLGPTGAVKYLSYLGGNSNDEMMDVALGVGSRVYVTGFTYSANFPLSANAFSRRMRYGEGYVSVLDVSKSGAASLVYSTFFGGGGDDEGHAIAVQNGLIYLSGSTDSRDVPLKNPVQTAYKGGNMASWAEGFAAVLDISKGPARQLVFSTYLGGINNDIPGGIAGSGTDYLYVVGMTDSYDFPKTGVSSGFGGDYDGFVTKLKIKAPTQIVYSRLVGGRGKDGIKDIAVDAQDNAYIAGGVGSPDFKTVAPLQSAFRGGAPLDSDFWLLTYWNVVDALVAKLDPAGKMTFGTYFGGTGADGAMGVRVGADGKVYVGGPTRSKNLRLVKAGQKANAGQYDAFVIAIDKLAPAKK